MPTMRFTAKGVSSIKLPTAGRVEYWDEGTPGFGMRISFTGSKTWVVMYRHKNRVRRLTLGSFPRLSLADAYEMAKEALHEAAKGKDPASRKREAREAESFAELAHEYLERHAKVMKKSWEEDEKMLKRDLLPVWGTWQAKDVSRKDVLRLLDSVVERGAPILANRVLALLRKIYNFGIQRDIIQVNPCYMVPAPAKEQRRDRVLNHDEIKVFWSVLAKEQELIGSYFKLLLLTAQRPGEVCRIEWSEIDFKASCWTIPATKAKNGVSHRVPLSLQAIDILSGIRNMADDSSWVFPSPTRDGPIQNIQKAVERIRTNTGVAFMARDLRRTAASHMTSLGISRLVVSKILNHKESGITAVYDRHSYDAEKRQALDVWGSYTDRIIMADTPLEFVPTRKILVLQKTVNSDE